MMGTLKGFAWNCGGLRAGTAPSHTKAMYFEKTFKNDFDIFFFLETHHRTQSEIPAEILRYQHTHHIIDSTATEDEKYTGIIGLVSKDFEIRKITHLIKGRILNIKMTKQREIYRLYI